LLRALALLGALAALTGCERPAVHPALRGVELPPLLTAHELVFNRQAFGSFSFSPDGKRLAWIGPHRWRSGLHVRDADGSVRVYRAGGSARHWSADGRRLLILDDVTGAENHHLYRLDLDDPNAAPKDLTPYPGVRVWLFQILAADPGHVLVLHNRRNRQLRDLYRLDLATGAEELLAANPGDGVVPITDAAGAFVGWRTFKGTARPRGTPRPPELTERSALSRQSDDVALAVGVAPDRSKAWVLTNRGRDRVALVSVDTASGRAALVHEDTLADVDRVLTSRITGQPLTVRTHADYPGTRVLDDALAADLQPLLERYRGMRHGFDIVAMDAAELRFVVTVYTHATRAYYLLDRTRKTHELLGHTRDAAFARALAVPEAVRFEAADGLSIPAYLVRPPLPEGTPLPLVVLVHGGPWQRVVWSDPDHSEDLLRAQFLASRGYAVLLVNFRGSTGYGRAFATAAVGEMGGRMQSDLVDAVRWAIAGGIADPAHVAILGYSYGGYAALMALAQQPALFACGIDIAGPTDLVDLIEHFPPYWELELHQWYSYVGDPAVPVDRARMQAASPLNWADKIERPVLIVHGRNDVRVRIARAERMVQALRAAGKPVEYLPLPDMGHALGYWAHHLAVLRASEAFLADCLGGRAARFDALEWAARVSGRLPFSR
jgi:dipeptidyl aminopeptidase/acylaminoacyl peptidase